MTVKYIYDTQNAIDSTRYNQICRDFIPMFRDSQGLKAPVDDLYKLAFMKFLMPTLDLSHVAVTSTPIDFYDDLNYIPVVVAHSYNRELKAEIHINPRGNDLQEYYLAMVILNTYCKGNQVTYCKFSESIFDQLRLYFDKENVYPGRTEDGRQIILNILFELDRRGYLDLVTVLDELVKSETISGSVIVEIQQYLGERAKPIEIEKKFEL